MKKKLLLFLLLISCFNLTGCDVSSFQGPQGEQGLPGEPGPQGEQGIPGKDGINGQDGKDGLPGKDGTNGLDGKDGAPGRDGSNGQDGLTPYIGEDGCWWIGNDNTGVRAAGQDGQDGTNGLDGKDGINGKSAFEIYKDNFGYKGTEQQWIYDFVNGRLAYNLSQVESITVPRIKLCAGEELKLPEKVNVTMKDGTYTQNSVIWDTSTFNVNNVGLRTIRGSVDGINYDAKCEIRTTNYNTLDRYIDGYVNYLLPGDIATVTIYNNEYLDTVLTDYNGYYCFDNVPNGAYNVKVDIMGYYLQESKVASISSVTTDSKSIYSNIDHVNFYMQDKHDSGYTFEWIKSDVDNSNETSAYVNDKINIEFVQSNDKVVDFGYASVLRDKYNILLVDNSKVWSTETINRFYELYTSLPSYVIGDKKSKWSLVDKKINNDITVTKKDGYDEVELSLDAIRNATPRVALINGQKGSYFSKRLYTAIVRYVTDGGNDAYKCETILNENFLTSFNCPDYVQLTKGITDEGPEQFQEFEPEEKLLILTMFEEMPKGMHKMKELKYLIRRVSGHKHPIYPEAAAVTWTTANTPYIEFMSTTFTDTQGYYHAKRLIIHEKTHMLWAHYFSEQLKSEWCKVGGWYVNKDDPDGWSTTKQTEFVSAYAHQHNPDEDMAESVATYVINPDLLRSRSINKYNFIKDYIMGGDMYILGIDEDMTFEVFNLNPDYVYPGMVEKIEVKVVGSPFEDKRITIRLHLHEGKDAGANGYYIRLYPKGEIGNNQICDIQGVPVNSEGTILEGSAYISKYSKKGYWYTDQIELFDQVGNERFESNSDYSLKVFVDNPLQDLEFPTVDDDSIKMEVRNANNKEHPGAQILSIKGKMNDNVGVKRVLVRLLMGNDNKETQDFDCIFDNEKGTFEVEIFIPENYSTGMYRIVLISVDDLAQNNIFHNIVKEKENTNIFIKTPNPDDIGPVLDKNRIELNAVPSKPDNPDGETYVTLKLPITDDLSGLRDGNIIFVDPQGITHFYHFTLPQRFDNYYPSGMNPTEEHVWELTFTLPKGSAPGIWGVYEIALEDMAHNVTVYNFTEIMHFEIIK